MLSFSARVSTAAILILVLFSPVSCLTDDLVHFSLNADFKPTGQIIHPRYLRIPDRLHNPSEVPDKRPI